MPDRSAAEWASDHPSIQRSPTRTGGDPGFQSLVRVARAGGAPVGGDSVGRRRLEVDLEAVEGPFDPVGQRELGRAMGQEHPFRPGCSCRSERLLGAQVAAGLAVVEPCRRVASQTNMSEPRASSTRRSLGPLSPEYAIVVPFGGEPEPVGLERVVGQAHGRYLEAGCREGQVGRVFAHVNARSNMSENPNRWPNCSRIARPPSCTHSSGLSSIAAPPARYIAPHTHGTMSPQWSRWKWVITIAPKCGQTSRSGAAPAHPARSRRADGHPGARGGSPSGRRPGWARRGSSR